MLGLKLNHVSKRGHRAPCNETHFNGARRCIEKFYHAVKSRKNWKQSEKLWCFLLMHIYTYSQMSCSQHNVRHRTKFWMRRMSHCIGFPVHTISLPCESFYDNIPTEHWYFDCSEFTFTNTIFNFQGPNVCFSCAESQKQVVGGT